MRVKIPAIGRTVTHEDVEELAAAVRAIAPIVGSGSDVVPHVTPGGTWYESSGGGRAGGMVRVQIPAGASWGHNTAMGLEYYGATHGPSGVNIQVWNRTGVTLGAAGALVGFAAYMQFEAEYQIVTVVCA